MGLLPSKIPQNIIPIEEIDCSLSDIKDVMKICNLKNKKITNVAHVKAWRIKMNGKVGRAVCGEQNSWEFLEKIGEESVVGKTFLSKCNKEEEKDTYVFKIVHFPNEHAIKMFYSEIDFQNKASKLKVTSPVYQIFMDTRKQFGMFVMDRYQVTVKRFFIEQLKLPQPNIRLLKRILNRCIEIDQLLQKHQIYHGDQHLNNFMLQSTDDLDNIEKYIKIIDFGEARIATKARKALTKEYKNIHDIITDIVKKSVIYIFYP
jgi:serine/threonine protein kinase